MNQNKALLTFATISIVLLVCACVGFFFIAWSSMSNVEQLREENHRLSLESTVCSLRLANTTGAASQSAVLPKPDVPVIAPETVEQLRRAAKTPAPQSLKPLAVKTVKPEAANAAVQAPKTTQVEASRSTEAPKTVGQPQTHSAQSVLTQGAALSEPKTPPTVRLPVAAPVDPAKRVWAVQVGAYKTHEVAQDGVLEVGDALRSAGMDDLPMLVGRGKGAKYWKVYVAPCATFKEAEQVRERLTAVLKTELFSTRLPKSLREASN